MAGQGFGYGYWTPEAKKRTARLNELAETGLGHVAGTFDTYKRLFQEHLKLLLTTPEQHAFIDAEIEYNQLLTPHNISGKDYLKRAEYAEAQKEAHKQPTLF